MTWLWHKIIRWSFLLLAEMASLTQSLQVSLRILGGQNRHLCWAQRWTGRWCTRPPAVGNACSLLSGWWSFPSGRWTHYWGKNPASGANLFDPQTARKQDGMKYCMFFANMPFIYKCLFFIRYWHNPIIWITSSSKCNYLYAVLLDFRMKAGLNWKICHF